MQVVGYGTHLICIHIHSRITRFGFGKARTGAPTWPPRSSQDRLRGGFDRAQIARSASNWVPRSTFLAQHGFDERFRSILARFWPILARFWSILARFSTLRGSILEVFRRFFDAFALELANSLEEEATSGKPVKTIGKP